MSLYMAAYDDTCLHELVPPLSLYCLTKVFSFDVNLPLICKKKKKKKWSFCCVTKAVNKAYDCH